jgi:hypothetical protein
METDRPGQEVAKTGHSKGHAFENWLAAIRRHGGHWPPSRKTKQEEIGKE